MKRLSGVFLLLAFTAIISCCLNGCGFKPGQMPEIDKNLAFPVSSAFHLLAVPADDGFYYIRDDLSNNDFGLCHEFSSGECEKLADRHLEHLFRCGDVLLFLNYTELCSYDITTGKLEKLIQNCSDYIVWNGSIVFKYQPSSDDFKDYDSYQESCGTLKMLTPEGTIESVSDVRVDQFWVYDGELYYSTRKYYQTPWSLFIEVFRYDGGESCLVCSDSSFSRVFSFVNFENGTLWFVREDRTYAIVDMKTCETVLSGEHRLDSNRFSDCNDFKTVIMSRDGIPEEYESWIRIETGDGYALVAFPWAGDVEKRDKNGGRYYVSAGYKYRLLAEENGKLRIVRITKNTEQ